MSLIVAILASIFAFFCVVMIHEFGHFIIAKMAGVKILRFSIGFGKALLKRKANSGTEYVIAVLPLGGYVKMHGEMNGLEPSTSNDPDSYQNKPLLSRMAIVLAGPIANFLLAIFLFWVLSMIGITSVKPKLGDIVSGSIAAVAGLKKGDEIVAIDNNPTNNWQKVTIALVKRMGDQNSMTMTTLSPGQSKPTLRYLELSNWKVDKEDPDLLKSLGLSAYQIPIPAVVGKIIPGSPADKSGLKINDRILTLNNLPTADWQFLVKEIKEKPSQKVILKIQRNGQTQSISLQIGEKKEKKPIGYIGVLPKPIALPPGTVEHEKYSWLTGWPYAIEQVGSIVTFNVIVIKKLIVGKLSSHVLGGPITIFQTAGQASLVGFTVYLGFIAYLSTALGFLNLLPIPGLDGGHFLFQVLEGLMRRPVPIRYQLISLQIGIFLLIMLMIFATLNDILRLV